MNMSVPLIVLAVFSALAGLVFSGFGLPFASLVSADGAGFEMHVDMLVAGVSTLLSVAAIGFAYVMYAKKNDMPDKITSMFGSFYTWAHNKFYFDEIWLFMTRKVIFNCISRPVAWFDKKFVDGFMDSLASVTQTVSEQIKGFQSGRIQQYAGAYLLGALILVVGFCGWVVSFILK